MEGVEGLLVAEEDGSRRGFGCFGCWAGSPEDAALVVYLPASRDDVRERLLRAERRGAGEPAVRRPARALARALRRARDAQCVRAPGRATRFVCAARAAQPGRQARRPWR